MTVPKVVSRQIDDPNVEVGRVRRGVEEEVINVCCVSRGVSGSRVASIESDLLGCRRVVEDQVPLARIRIGGVEAHGKQVPGNLWGPARRSVPSVRMQERS